jgi:uncharacterized protein YdeI (YjbR/CyaY-like superfamily)
MRSRGKSHPPKLLFKDQKAWVAWLEKNHQSSDGICMRLAKKGSGLTSVSYADALEVALCYGCIDGQKLPENERTWLQKFLPRSEKSLWSKINREKALLLIKNGCMQPAGLQAIERAKAAAGRLHTIRPAAPPFPTISRLHSKPTPAPANFLRNSIAPTATQFSSAFKP